MRTHNKSVLTEIRLRSLIREAISTALCESAAEVAEVVAEVLPDGPDIRELADELSQRLDQATLIGFVRSKRDPAAVKAFEDALMAHSEWRIDPKDAWLQAWRGAYLSTRSPDESIM